MLLPYPDTKQLQVDDLEDGIILLSHEDALDISPISTYPRDFSCELVVHTPIENGKIMLRFEEFYVPSKTKNCVENYVYVFDSNTAKSKAMPEAGGERGLCGQSYPKLPIFTSRSYVCIVFHTSPQRPVLLSGYKPGFKIILTAVRETTSQTCPSDNFYCGTIPKISSPQSVGTRSYSSFDNSNTGNSRPFSLSGKISYETDDMNKQSINTGYCIMKENICDGVVNCANGKDEEAVQCDFHKGNELANLDSNVSDLSMSMNWLSGFLSLGIPASIAIAVSTIIIFTLSIGAVICCCHRCCQSSNNQTTGRRDRLLIDSSHSGNGFHLVEQRTNTNPIFSNLLLTGRCNLVNSVNLTCGRRPLYQPQRYPYDFNVYPALNDPGNFKMDANTTNKSPPIMTSVPHKILLGSNQFPSISQTTRLPGAQYVTLDQLGNGSYSSINTSSARGYGPATTTTVFCSPPDAYRRDQICYTPPPYGACNVPPASSVTASSSRTGTTSGGPHEPLQNSRYASYNRDLCKQDANDHSHRQLSSGSVKHTNTPVETISQGGDLVSNGGILYLGEIYRPLSIDSSSKFLRPSSATTESGSSCGLKLSSRGQRQVDPRCAHQGCVSNPSQDAMLHGSHRHKTSHCQQYP